MQIIRAFTTRSTWYLNNPFHVPSDKFEDNSSSKYYFGKSSILICSKYIFSFSARQREQEFVKRRYDRDEIFTTNRNSRNKLEAWLKKEKCPLFRLLRKVCRAWNMGKSPWIRWKNTIYATIYRDLVVQPPIVTFDRWFTSNGCHRSIIGERSRFALRRRETLFAWKSR